MTNLSELLELEDRPSSVVTRWGSTVANIAANHTMLIGGTLATVTLFSAIAVNALWYQPNAHVSSFFVTRDMAEQSGTTGQGSNDVTITNSVPNKPELDSVLAENTQPRTINVTGDPQVRKVQEILTELNIYHGVIDGKMGPQTRSAIISYQRAIGLQQTGNVDRSLQASLGAAASTPAATVENEPSYPVANVPVPTPRPRHFTEQADTQQQDGQATTTDNNLPNQTVAQVQAGLKAFGNHHISIDGKAGAQTKNALLEFQSLFGLPQTGQIDQTVISKMQEIGLIR